MGCMLAADTTEFIIAYDGLAEPISLFTWKDICSAKIGPCFNSIVPIDFSRKELSRFPLSSKITIILLLLLRLLHILYARIGAPDSVAVWLTTNIVGFELSYI